MRKLKFLKKSFVIFAVAIIAIIVGSIIVRYSVEGEENLPFEVSKIMVISNAYGQQKEESQNKWDLDLVQNNDVYIDILKNKNYNKDEIIDKVILSNFWIEEKPQKGEVTIYNASSLENGVYHNQEQYKVIDKLEFEGNEEKTDIKNFQISNQGGLILLRVVNQNIGTYTSNEEAEIRHDGSILTKAGVTNEDITFKLTFDLSIELKSEKNYKTKVNLEMPKGNLTGEGTTNYQIFGKEELVFKRY